MSTPSNTPILTQEQMDQINAEALAAVKRGREALAAARQSREKSGLTHDKLHRGFASLTPGSRAWINTAVAAGLAELTGRKPETAKARPRKTRSLV